MTESAYSGSPNLNSLIEGTMMHDHTNELVMSNGDTLVWLKPSDLATMMGISGVIELANLAAFPIPGIPNTIYLALDSKKLYYWAGSSYTEMSPSPMSTDSLSEGSTNLYFTNTRAISALSASLAGKYNNPTGSTSQYIRGDGSIVAFPSTGVATSSTNGLMSAGDKAKLDAYPAYQSRVFNNSPAVSIVTTAAAANGTRLSTTRDISVNYSFTIIANASGLLAGASSAYIVLEICATNSAVASDWIEIGRIGNGQTFTSLLTLQSSQPIGGSFGGKIQTGWYHRKRFVTVSGAGAQLPTIAYNGGQEVSE